MARALEIDDADCFFIKMFPALDLNLVDLEGCCQYVLQRYRIWEWSPRKPEGRGRVFEATLSLFPQKGSGAEKHGPGRRASFLTTFDDEN
ncbi:hypothetical protein HNR65_001575 [Desulfosalsimonas propionicica]|uniref:Uncharacterized protein n=1 Tax=Desulfosalsimonas propionicica TaxID=332175 RepID=A0A7W0C8Q1_9BACT|nr:hypothetical protein [Desulfosalsimonas propionicica]MBA2881249.1 hypothetical protein [Desulfosalsimonas propionicica]